MRYYFVSFARCMDLDVGRELRDKSADRWAPTKTTEKQIEIKP